MRMALVVFAVLAACADPPSTSDGGQRDATVADSGTVDAGRPDAARPDDDAGQPDASRDAGAADGGAEFCVPVDAGNPFHDGGRIPDGIHCVACNPDTGGCGPCFRYGDVFEQERASYCGPPDDAFERCMPAVDAGPGHFLVVSDMRTPDRTERIRLVRRETGGHVIGISYNFALHAFAHQDDAGVTCILDEAALLYANTHHNWEDVSEAVVDGKRYVVNFYPFQSSSFSILTEDRSQTLYGPRDLFPLVCLGFGDVWGGAPHPCSGGYGW